MRARTSVVSAMFLALCSSRASSQEAITLTEKIDPNHVSKVDVGVNLTGKLAVPNEKGQAPQLVAITGNSRVVYEERVLAPDEPGMLKAIRTYRDVQFLRVVGDSTQDAGIRPSVRRMVVIKADGRRAPFSPDGPLTWGEIDVVRTDVFNLAAVPGLLPAGPVKKGQSWKASSVAIAELTDMEKVESGEIVVELIGVTEVEKKRVAKLKVSGTVKGVNEDGPNEQTLDGTAYFDLAMPASSHIFRSRNAKLLDGNGQTVGLIEGQFTMNRARLAKCRPISRMPRSPQ